MRIRSTKPEFWRSARICSVSWDARLVLKGLESYVDDNGVGKDDVALIVADVFPRDMVANPRETVARVSEAISALHQAGLVHRYEADGQPLLYMSFWEQFQRIDKPGKGRLPRPDGTSDYGASSIRESVASPRESVAPGTGEQGNRGTVSLAASEVKAPPAEPEVEKPERKPRSRLIPDSWSPTDAHRKRCAENRFDTDALAEAFRDWHKSKGTKYADWDAAFNNWIRKAITMRAEQAQRNGATGTDGFPSLLTHKPLERRR